MNRPSKKELFRKIRDAKEAVQKGKVFLVDPDVIAEDAIELVYDICYRPPPSREDNHIAGSFS